MSDWGPYFGKGELAVGAFFCLMMNGEKSGHCFTDGICYNIPADKEGNNIVTGDVNRFTCIDLEVFSVVYDIHPYEDHNF